jgi:glutathione S-transferase
MIKIYGVNVSAFVRKVRVVLAEKGLSYELVPVDLASPSPEFLALTPVRKVPVFQDEQVVLPDSSAIVAYLERRHPTPALLPADPAQYGRALFYEEYGDSIVYGALVTVFVQRVFVPFVLKGTPDEKVIADALARTPAVLDYLEGEVANREWLAGGQFSVADISIASPFVNWGYAGEKVDATRWPKLAAYLERVLARPSFRALIEEEAAVFGR